MTLSVEALAAIAAAVATPAANAAAGASATGLAGGTVELLDGAGTVLASASVGTPTAAGAVVTMSGYPRTVTGTAGAIASARYRTAGGGAWKVAMTVGLADSGAQVIVSALAILAGQQVTIVSATLSHAATVS